MKVVDQIVHNRYSAAWGDLHPADQKVAPSNEYIECETRSTVLAAPTSVKVLSVGDESVGIGDGSFLPRKVAVDPAAVAVPRLQGEPLSGRCRLDTAAVDVVATPSF